jgi:hypothetical protein
LQVTGQSVVWAHQDLNLGPLRYQDNGARLSSDRRSRMDR